MLHILNIFIWQLFRLLTSSGPAAPWPTRASKLRSTSRYLAKINQEAIQEHDLSHVHFRSMLGFMLGSYFHVLKLHDSIKPMGFVPMLPAWMCSSAPSVQFPWAKPWLAATRPTPPAPARRWALRRALVGRSFCHRSGRDGAETGPEAFGASAASKKYGTVSKA